MYRATRGIVAIVLVLALAAGTQAVGDAAATDAAAGIAGTWEGRIDTPPPLDVVVRVEFEDGAASGTVDIPAQGAFGLPLEAIEVEVDAVRFVIDGVPGTPSFEGTLEAERLTGTFVQGEMSFPFELERVDEGIAPRDGVAPEAAVTAAPDPGPAPDDAAGEPIDVYEDPAGVFTFPIPAGWTVETAASGFASEVGVRATDVKRCAREASATETRPPVHRRHEAGSTSAWETRACQTTTCASTPRSVVLGS